MPAKCGCDTLKARLARELLPEGLENFRRQLQHGLACGEAAITLQGKGKESDDRQVQGCLSGILRDNGSILLQAVATKTAPSARTEKIPIVSQRRERLSNKSYTQSDTG